MILGTYYNCNRHAKFSEMGGRAIRGETEGRRQMTEDSEL
jgi:hypothetical protein